jgi:hypothetical protein
MNTRLKETASQTDYMRLQNHFTNYVPISEYLNTKEKLKVLRKKIKQMYIKRDDLEDTVQYFRDEMAKKLELRISHEQYNERMK